MQLALFNKWFEEENENKALILFEIIKEVDKKAEWIEVSLNRARDSAMIYDSSLWFATDTHGKVLS